MDEGVTEQLHSFASRQDGSYPRPQLVRSQYVSLDRRVGFAYDDEDGGRVEHWEREAAPFDRTILLPFSPESPASGIGETGFHPIVWYRLDVGADDLRAAGVSSQGERVLLHFGAVDHVTDVWVDGTHVGRHEGGQTAFGFDITEALSDDDAHVITVRAEDDPHDAAKPRGKQDWLEHPHSIWYERMTGIWRTVWLEAVPPHHIGRVDWIAEFASADVSALIELEGCMPGESRVRVELFRDGDLVAATETVVTGSRADIRVPIEARRNGQDRQNWEWSPTRPVLVDAVVTLSTIEGAPIDTVSSYFGIRSVAVSGGRFVLNNRIVPVRSVLEQGYWPDSHFTPPSSDALRREVELILSLGFNATRIHQKTEDPRFLYWADRLGLMVWGEIASALEFHPVAVERTTTEWMRTVRDYRSHPSIVTWVPFNESWGVHAIASSPEEQAFSSGLSRLTRAIDPSRPVISNDGWEHTDSDIWTIHDYEESGHVLGARYGDAAGVEALLDGRGPAGRVIRAAGSRAGTDAAVMVTEFGGVSFESDAESENWGYSTASDGDDFRARIAGLIGALNASSALAGFCYTQLTDTRQETNGLCDANRVPKLPARTIAAIVTGQAPPSEG